MIFHQHENTVGISTMIFGALFDVGNFQQSRQSKVPCGHLEPWKQIGRFGCTGGVQFKGKVDDSFFFVGQIAVRLNHQVDILFDLIPAKKNFLVVWIVFKRQALAVMVKPAATSIQIGVRGATGSVWSIFFGKSFCPEVSVRLQLINFPSSNMPWSQPSER